MEKTYPNLKGVIWLAICFHLLLFSYFSAVVIQPSVLRDNGYENLGFYSIVILYIFASIVCFVAPIIANKYKLTLVLCVSALPYLIWVFVPWLTSFPTIPHGLIAFLIVAGSALFGSGVAVIWVAQGKQMALYQKICPDKAGMYLGIFWTITLGAQVTAFLFNSIVLSFAEPQLLFLLDTFIAILAAVLFLFTPKAVLPENYIEEIVSPSESFKRVFVMLKDIRMIKIYGLFINSSLAVANAQIALVPLFSQILENEPFDVRLRISAKIMIILGIGGMLGSQILGFVNDRFNGSKSVAIANIFLHIIQYGGLIIVNEIHSISILCFIVAFFMGTGDGSMMTQLQILFASEFDEAATPNALLNVFKGVGIALFSSIISMCTDQQKFRVYFISVLIITVAFQVLLIFTFKFQTVEKKTNIKQSQENEMHQLINKS